MKCTNCGERDGVVNLTQIEDGEVRTGSLCAQCAKAKGIDTGLELSGTPLGGFLAALGEGSEAAGVPDLLEDGRCGSCGASLKDFRDTGRVGCADCYRTFDAALRELLRRIHGSTHHTGMRHDDTGVPAEPGVSRVSSSPVHQLREELRRAIESEQFERAAELRDRLREHE